MPNPPFIDMLNTLYHGVTQYAPQYLQERPEASAFMLGFGVSYGAVRLAQLASKKVVNRFVSGFHEKILPKLEWICIAGTVATPAAAILINREGAVATMQQHPAYVIGLTGCAFAGILAAGLGIGSRAKSEKLEEKTKN